MEEGSMISCIQWIKSGHPSKASKKTIIPEYIEANNEDSGVPMFTPVDNPDDFEDDFPEEIEDSESDEDEINFKQEDRVIMAGKIDQEFSSLEVYIFEQSQGNLFVHHDYLLSSYPVSMEWLGASLFGVEAQNVLKGNFGILGLMTPDIEIWDLDIIDSVEP